MAPGNRKAPQRSSASESSYSLAEFMHDFPDDESCLQWLWQTRYAVNEQGTEAQCEKCECITEFKRYATKQQRQSWTCTQCGHHVHPTAGTIFHKSSTSLVSWFYAMYLMTSTRCGISAKQLERELGVTYKTAWRMFTLIRNELMVQDDDEPKLSGEVEMDEMYVGGRVRAGERAAYAHLERPYDRHKAAQELANKKRTPVFGMVQRGGQVRAYVAPRAMGRFVRKQIAVDVEPGTHLFTDEAPIYARLSREGWYHEKIQHLEQVYVSGNVHTQTIDGFWSMVKRGTSGTHYHVSSKWLQGYLNEYAWRYNRRGPAAPDVMTRKQLFQDLLRRSALITSR
ncbi:MAG TPA: IS1595 family transposase [Acidimicrobiales bacterium]|nr:IS1595 family transposase [Acidimicrobiales bacterium]